MPSEIVAALPMPALVVAPDGRIESDNRAARKLFGDAILNRHYITVLRQPSLLDAVEQAISRQVPTVATYLTTEARKDVTLEAHCAPLPSGSVMLVFEDRTAMQEAGQMRRNFVANVSHELKTPLTALTGFIETLRGAARDDPEARERFLEIMEREAARMNRLIADLLSLSRVEADARVRPKGRADIAALLRSVVNTLEPLARDGDMKVVTEGIDDDLFIPGDADQLSQVATNLIENAIKYSGRGSTVTVALRRDAQNAVLRRPACILDVTDTGEGIDQVHIPRLTERFYRIDNHRSREKGGTGLGLAIVKHIVNRHRGRLRITSVPGRGSRFSVILPESFDDPASPS